jgi:hypothetical protein
MRRHLQAARHANVATVKFQGSVKAQRIEEAQAARLGQQILHLHTYLARGVSMKLSLDLMPAGKIAKSNRGGRTIATCIWPAITINPHLYHSHIPCLLTWVKVLGHYFHTCITLPCMKACSD